MDGLGVRSTPVVILSMTVNKQLTVPDLHAILAQSLSASLASIPLTMLKRIRICSPYHPR